MAEQHSTSDIISLGRPGLDLDNQATRLTGGSKPEMHSPHDKAFHNSRIEKAVAVWRMLDICTICLCMTNHVEGMANCSARPNGIVLES